MDLKKLQYLEAVYRLKNLTQAAAEQYVSQPAMTKAIRALEEELGTQLIRRSNTGVSFTYEGERFIPYVYRILSDVKQAEEEMKELLNQQSKVLSLSVSNIATCWLQKLIFLEFVPSIPGCVLNISGPTSDEMIQSLLDEELDLVYTIFPDYLPPELVKIPLIRSELQMVIPCGHPLERYTRIPDFALDGQTLLTYPEGALIRAKIKERCIACGAIPIMQNPSGQREVVLTLTSMGVGITHTLVNPYSQEVLDTGLITRGFEEPIYFDEGIIYNTNHYLNKTAKAFIAFMKDRFLKGPAGAQ